MSGCVDFTYVWRSLKLTLAEQLLLRLSIKHHKVQKENKGRI